MPALADEFEYEERIAELEATATRLQRQLSAAKAKTSDLVEAIYAAAKDAATVVGTPKPVAVPPRRKKKGDPEVALLHLTDWQLGKETDSYDSDVAVARVRSAVEKTIRLAEIQRADHPVESAVLLLGGDLVENVSIFPGQAYEVDSTAFAQVFRASGVIEEAVLSLLGAFREVAVYEVSGNHGRIGRKGDSPREDNLDRIVGKIARDRLANQPRLEWREPSSWYEIVEVGNYRALLVHGDQIKSFGGNTPAFGISRKATAWSSGVTEPWTDCYLGHFHQALTLTIPNGGRVFMTPSTESGSEYAREFVAARGKPAQRLHFVHPERGIVTGEYLLWLD